MATSPTPPTSQSGAAADARDAGDSLAERINAELDILEKKKKKEGQ